MPKIEKREAGSGQGQDPLKRQVSRHENGAAPPASRLPHPPTCQRCGFPVKSRAWGCKHPCPNCGTVYPLGDCSD